MDYNFPSAHDARLQLIYDRHAALYDSTNQLACKIVKMAIEGNQTSSSFAFAKLCEKYKELRLYTMLGLVDPEGIFKTTVKFDVDLWKELVTSGGWCIKVSDDEKTMEVTNEHLVPKED